MTTTYEKSKKLNDVLLNLLEQLHYKTIQTHAEEKTDETAEQEIADNHSENHVGEVYQKSKTTYGETFAYNAEKNQSSDKKDQSIDEKDYSNDDMDSIETNINEIEEGFEESIEDKSNDPQIDEIDQIQQISIDLDSTFFDMVKTNANNLSYFTLIQLFVVLAINVFQIRQIRHWFKKHKKGYGI